MSKTPSAAPILNDDLLLDTFSLLADKTRSSFRDILAISHVCSHWRSITISSPELWRRFVFLTKLDGTRSEEYTRTMLSRCKDVSLDGSWGLGSTRKGCWKDALQSFRDELKYFNRIRSFTFEGPAETFAEMLSDLVPCSAPVLEELFMSTRWGQTFTVDFVPDLGLFKGDLSALTSLTLHQCWMDVSRLNLKNLRQLYCLGYFKVQSSIPSKWGSPHTMNGWINVIKQFPHLTTLSLDVSLHPASPTDEPPVDAPVHLPHLSDLTLQTNFSQIQRFMDLVSMPACKRLQLVVTNLWHQSFDFDLLAKIVSKYTIPSPHGNRICIYPDQEEEGEEQFFKIGFSPVVEKTRVDDINWSIDDETVVLQGAVHLGTFLSTFRSVVKHVTSIRIPVKRIQHVDEDPIRAYVGEAIGLRTLICPESSMETVLRSRSKEAGFLRLVYSV